MATQLNLSSRPFRNRRGLWTGIVIILFICAISGLWIRNEKADALQQISDTQRRIASQKAAVEQKRKEDEQRRADEAKIKISPQESYELAEARQFIQLKTFSWDKLLSDVETYLPDETKVTSLKVAKLEPAPGGIEADIELAAEGKTATQMTEMMSRLDKSGGLFVITDVGQGQADEAGLVPFAIKIHYNPWAGGEGK